MQANLSGVCSTTYQVYAGHLFRCVHVKLSSNLVNLSSKLFNRSDMVSSPDSLRPFLPSFCLLFVFFLPSFCLLFLFFLSSFCLLFAFFFSSFSLLFAFFFSSFCLLFLFFLPSFCLLFLSFLSSIFCLLFCLLFFSLSLPLITVQTVLCCQQDFWCQIRSLLIVVASRQRTICLLYHPLTLPPPPSKS